MHKLTILCAVLVATLTSVATSPSSAGDEQAVTQAWEKTKEEAGRLALAGRIRARLIDRKDIKSRYVRIHVKGETVQLAGFIDSPETGTEIARIAAGEAGGATVQTYWQTTANLQEQAPYRTYVGEQAADFTVWAKVNASLAAPDVRSLLKNAEIVAVDVRHGKVTAFVVADAPPTEFDLAPHVSVIDGVKSFNVEIVRTYSENVEQP